MSGHPPVRREDYGGGHQGDPLRHRHLRQQPDLHLRQRGDSGLRGPEKKGAGPAAGHPPGQPGGGAGAGLPGGRRAPQLPGGGPGGDV